MLNNDFFVASILYGLFASSEEERRRERARQDWFVLLASLGVLAIAGIIFFIGLKLGW